MEKDREERLEMVRSRNDLKARLEEARGEGEVERAELERLELEAGLLAACLPRLTDEMASMHRRMEDLGETEEDLALFKALDKRQGEAAARKWRITSYRIGDVDERRRRVGGAIEAKEKAVLAARRREEEEEEEAGRLREARRKQKDELAGLGKKGDADEEGEGGELRVQVSSGGDFSSSGSSSYDSYDDDEEEDDESDEGE